MLRHDFLERAKLIICHGFSKYSSNQLVIGVLATLWLSPAPARTSNLGDIC